eukprot:Sspe_Gene.16245::Locus_5723_Transcript_1_1_Confidence_1.000_Length_3531::g.16245::m.16245
MTEEGSVGDKGLPSDEVDWRELIIDEITTSRPEDLPKVEGWLEEYRGREEELYRIITGSEEADEKEDAETWSVSVTAARFRLDTFYSIFDPPCLEKVPQLLPHVVDQASPDMVDGSALDRVLELLCQKYEGLGAKAAAWLGKECPALFGHLLVRFYEKHDPAAADTIPTLVEMLQNKEIASINEFIARLCDRYHVDPSTWTGDYPEALGANPQQQNRFSRRPPSGAKSSSQLSLAQDNETAEDGREEYDRCLSMPYLPSERDDATSSQPTAPTEPLQQTLKSEDSNVATVRQLGISMPGEAFEMGTPVTPPRGEIEVESCASGSSGGNPLISITPPPDGDHAVPGDASDDEAGYNKSCELTKSESTFSHTVPCDNVMETTVGTAASAEWEGALPSADETKPSQGPYADPTPPTSWPEKVKDLEQVFEQPPATPPSDDIAEAEIQPTPPQSSVPTAEPTPNPSPTLSPASSPDKQGTAHRPRSVSDSRQGSKDTKQLIDRLWWKSRIEAFYMKHNPEKIAGVDKLLESYVGQEPALYEALVQKYEKGPPSLPPASERSTSSATPSMTGLPPDAPVWCPGSTPCDTRAVQRITTPPTAPHPHTAWATSQVPQHNYGRPASPPAPQERKVEKPLQEWYKVKDVRGGQWLRNRFTGERVKLRDHAETQREVTPSPGTQAVEKLLRASEDTRMPSESPTKLTGWRSGERSSRKTAAAKPRRTHKVPNTMFGMPGARLPHYASVVAAWRHPVPNPGAAAAEAARHGSPLPGRGGQGGHLRDFPAADWGRRTRDVQTGGSLENTPALHHVPEPPTGQTTPNTDLSLSIANTEGLREAGGPTKKAFRKKKSHSATGDTTALEAVLEQQREMYQNYIADVTSKHEAAMGRVTSAMELLQGEVDALRQRCAEQAATMEYERVRLADQLEAKNRDLMVMEHDLKMAKDEMLRMAEGKDAALLEMKERCSAAERRVEDLERVLSERDGRLRVTQAALETAVALSPRRHQGPLVVRSPSPETNTNTDLSRHGDTQQLEYPPVHEPPVPPDDDSHSSPPTPPDSCPTPQHTPCVLNPAPTTPASRSHPSCQGVSVVGSSPANFVAASHPSWNLYMEFYDTPPGGGSAAGDLDTLESQLEKLAAEIRECGAIEETPLPCM